MFHSNRGFVVRGSGLCGALAAGLLLAGCEVPDELAAEDPAAAGAEDVSAQSQPIIAGSTIDPNSSSSPSWTKRIIDFGGCVGTIIDANQEWVLTAAHCVPPKLIRNVGHYPTNAWTKTSHVFSHPTLDVGLAHLVTPIATGHSGTVPLYTSSASSLVGKTVEAYGYGWRAVDWNQGRGCTQDSDCASGYTCSVDWSWCRKNDSLVNGNPVLRHAPFVVDSVADSSSTIVLRLNPDKQLVAPGDSGGPDFLSNGTIAGVHSRGAYALTYSKSINTPSVKDWVATRMACPLFNVNHFSSSACTSDCPCDIGQGDCDDDADCLPGLVCKQYGTNRRAHGFPTSYDICVDPACPDWDPANPPSNAACKYSAGQGDCDNDDECGGALVCRADIGQTLIVGANPILDLCVNQPAPGCTQDVCTPSCPCDLGEGNCTTSADCRDGLMCGRNMGAASGHAPNDDICVEPEAIPCSSDTDCPDGSCVWGACRWIAPIPANPSSECGILRANEGMYPNQPIYSCDGRFRLYLQGDSNLVLSMKDHGDFNIALWTTGNATIGKDGYTLYVGVDGNLVLYDSVRVPIWATGTTSQPTYLHIEDDGNMILFGTVRDASGHLPQLWKTNTGGH